MIASTVRRDRPGTDIAVSEHRRRSIAILPKMRKPDEGDFARLMVVLVTDVRDGHERMSAMASPLGAVGAVAPGAFQADVTIPIVLVGESEA